MSTSLVCWIGSTRNWIGGISGSICTEYSKTQRAGRPSYPPVVLFKVLLLQQWYGLSNPMAEEAIGDRLSFRRFLGFGLMENSCRDPGKQKMREEKNSMRDSPARGLMLNQIAEAQRLAREWWEKHPRKK